MLPSLLNHSSRMSLATACLTLLLTACGGGNGSTTVASADDIQSGQTSLQAGRKKTTPLPIPSREPAPATTGRIVTPEFFGMHIAAQRHEGWPAVKFGTQRLWDSWPSVAWADIHKGVGSYHWAELDAQVADSLAHGVELVYTFGYVPAWASTNSSGACDGATPGSCYAPNPLAWQEFVKAITTRYQGKIKYWELWNEPNAGNFWKGSNAQLVSMAKDAYSIIRSSGGTVLSPSPQGTSAASWLDAYFSAGGTAYADIVSFHGYLYGPPETLNQLVANMRSVKDKHGIGHKPTWDTEHSWGSASWPMGGDEDQQAAWLARYQVLSFFHGIDRSFWYGWEHFTWGTLFDRTTDTIKKPGIAYREVYNWMIGASFSPCQITGSLYQCKLTRSNGYEAQIVWSATGQTNYTVPAGYVRMRAIDGIVSTVQTGQVISAGMKPVLIER